jgi:hypothetical protein
MPGYGIAADREGMLPWAWAEARLTSSHDYWLATTWPDGRPHVMPVWGLWLRQAIWFSTGLRSRKARNLVVDPRCVVATDDAVRPVVVEGQARQRTEPETIRMFLEALNTKYDSDISEEFLDPDVNGVFEVRPTWVFALDDDKFDTSPTRWSF